jgi:uncharacterized protein YndB with AHSA1/START domain
MSKIRFENEYEMRASQKILYPYLDTPSGLARWFADDVKIDEDKVFHFFWNDESQRARITARRRDQFIRFEYLPGDGKQALPEVGSDGELPYIEFLLEKSEITQSVFLKVTDCTEIDEDECEALWESMINTLRETVGG